MPEVEITGILHFVSNSDMRSISAGNIYSNHRKECMIKLKTVSGFVNQIDESVNAFLDHARKSKYEIVEMNFRTALSRTREDKAEMHCIVFIRYDDGKQKMME
jgi:hypothetical protein